MSNSVPLTDVQLQQSLLDIDYECTYDENNELNLIDLPGYRFHPTSIHIFIILPYLQ